VQGFAEATGCGEFSTRKNGDREELPQRRHFRDFYHSQDEKFWFSLDLDLQSKLSIDIWHEIYQF